MLIVAGMSVFVDRHGAGEFVLRAMPLDPLDWSVSAPACALRLLLLGVFLSVSGLATLGGRTWGLWLLGCVLAVDLLRIAALSVGGYPQSGFSSVQLPGIILEVLMGASAVALIWSRRLGGIENLGKITGRIDQP